VIGVAVVDSPSRAIRVEGLLRRYMKAENEIGRLHGTNQLPKAILGVNRAMLLG
jgi:hypothetical protein